MEEEKSKCIQNNTQKQKRNGGQDHHDSTVMELNWGEVWGEQRCSSSPQV